MHYVLAALFEPDRMWLTLAIWPTFSGLLSYLHYSNSFPIIIKHSPPTTQKIHKRSKTTDALHVSFLLKPQQILVGIADAHRAEPLKWYVASLNQLPCYVVTKPSFTLPALLVLTSIKSGPLQQRNSHVFGGQKSWFCLRFCWCHLLRCQRHHGSQLVPETHILPIW